MKKLFYIMLLFVLSAMTIAACTEQEIKPAATSNGGGGASDPVGH